MCDPKSKTKHIEEEVEICSYCDGEGKLYTNSWCTNYIKTRHIYLQQGNPLKQHVCDNCNGLGRLRKITTIEYKQL